MQAQLNELHDLARQHSEGTISDTEYVKKVVATTASINATEFAAAEAREHRQGLTVMVRSGLEYHLSSVKQDDVSRKRRERQLEDLSTKIEAGIEWLYDNGYKVTCDDERVFHITDPNDDEDGYHVYDVDPRIIIEAHEFLTSV